MEIAFNSTQLGEMIVGYVALFLVVLAITLFLKYGKRYAQYWNRRRLDLQMEAHMRRQEQLYNAARRVYERRMNGDL